MKSIEVLIALLMLATMSACGHPQFAEPDAISNERAFLDIQAGWRIRVVTPILKSGTFKVQTQQLGSSSNGTINLKTSDAFEGYETDFYRIDPPDQSGIAVQFVSAEVTDANGNRTRKAQPIIPLFIFPQGIRYVRLLFLTRVSQTEHNQAIIGATSLAALEQLTKKVEINPDGNCRNSTGEVCSWVPEGISVQPEKKPNKGKEWIPAL